MSYSLSQYGRMIGPENHRRVAAFEQALKETVTEKSIVLDIGTGPGYFALLAAKFGAAHVYAIETNPIVGLANRLAEDNGLADRITFFHEASTEIELPQKADIIVSDLGGALSLSNINIPSLIDAQKRHLAPGGLMIPEQTSLSAAVVSTPDIYSELCSPWEQPAHNFNFERARIQTLNAPQSCQLNRDQLLSHPHRWWKMNYLQYKETNASTNLSLPIVKADTAHGIVLWTDYRLASGIEISSAPGEPPLPIYGQLLLPWTSPVELATGDIVDVSLQASHFDSNYIWSWHTQIRDGVTGDHKATFRQADLPPISPLTQLG